MTTISNLNLIATPDASRDVDARKFTPHAQEPAATAIKDSLDLFTGSRSLPESYHSLSDNEKKDYLKNLAHLLKNGIIGTETLQVRGESYVSFASTRFGDPEVTHARLAR